jgi:hypothetical protein
MASTEEKKARRRTIVVYAKAGADAAENIDVEAPQATDAPLSPKEKLMKTKNLMYSDREAELLEDLCRLLITVQPRFVRVRSVRFWTQKAAFRWFRFSPTFPPAPWRMNSCSDPMPDCVFLRLHIKITTLGRVDRV